MLIRLIRISLLASAVLVLSAQSSYACSCMDAGDFTEYSKGQTVIRGKVNSYGPRLNHGETLYETMTVNIDKLIQGSFSHSTIEFIGDPGHLCLTYVDSDAYLIGSEHLFTVFSDDEKQGLGGCGEVSVLIVDGKVKGGKFDAKGNWVGYSIEYNKFVESLTKSQALAKAKPWWKFW